jgi:16S rRNA (uracil1498-N3)-methyltransferase
MLTWGLLISSFAMHTPRFYVPLPMASGEQLTLPSQAAHHAVRVLRLRVGDVVQVFDGSGKEYSGCIEFAEGSTCIIVLGESFLPAVESPIQIRLGQGLTQADKFDWVLQKAVELGVTCIDPIQMTRSIVRLDKERAQKKLSHWEGVVISAVEQSGRVKVPEVSPVAINVEHWLASLPDGPLRVRLAPEVKATFAQLTPPKSGVVLVVGPEGGFDPSEIQQLEAAQFVSVSLGPRVLRTETAALAAISSLQSCFGDFRLTTL